MKILKIFNWDRFKKNLTKTTSRFPLGIILILVLTILLMIGIDGHDLTRESLIVFYTLMLSIGTNLISEGSKKLKKYIYYLQIIPILFGIYLYFKIPTVYITIDLSIFYIILGLSLFSIIFIGPFLNDIYYKNIDKNLYISYLFKMVQSIVLGFIISTTIFILSIIGIFAVDSLFNLRLDGDIYLYVLILSYILIGLYYIIQSIPLKSSTVLRKYNLFDEIFIKYILIVASIVYFLILYSYSVYALLSTQTPRGTISWLVIGFSIVGYLSYILSSIFDKDKFVDLFKKIFPYAVIPMLGMLGYAIYLRIGQYDLTVNRYLVVIFGIWLLTISLYLIISKKKLIIYIPLSIFIFNVIISIGPWSIYSYPLSRQTTVLNKELTEIGILSGNTINPVDLDYTNTDMLMLSNNIRSRLRYICNFNDCNNVKNIFPEQYEIAVSKGDSNSSYNPFSNYYIANDILIQIGLEDQSTLVSKNSENYYHLSYSGFEDLRPIDTSNYIEFVDLTSYYNIYELIYKSKNSSINLNGDTIYLGDMLDKLADNYNLDKYGNISPDDVKVDISGDNYDYNMYIKSIDFYIDDGVYRDLYISGYLFKKR